ncbi:MAG TPA: metal ABC transporter ATP-binding protein [Desulfatiglandales bacterium]|nr:metal ABC transporter ATP-binding protein [Desulfatiglandales bacterium]
MSDPKIIEIEDLWFSYNGNPVLKEVSLKIRSGDFLAIIGPNGGGKTTLVKLILGILEPDRGIIRVFSRPPREAASRIGYVPQDIHVNKGFPISVRDVVLMGRLKVGKGWKRFSKKDRAIVQQALERVEMWEYCSRRMDDLSGGQRQRVYLARAMVSEPEILFLDEPMSSVDTKGQTEFYDFLRDLNKSVTIVVVTHDAMVISSHAKSVACVNQQLFFHNAPEVTKEMLEMAYQCPVELIAHGLPHRVLPEHSEE